jgi:hypothetical protein
LGIVVASDAVNAMTKTLNGVVHGRTIELSDDPGLTDGEHVVVELRSANGGPPDERTLAPPLGTKGPSAREVLGLWNPRGEPLDDAECRRILEDELLRKHGQ